jgi:hypothetical protein
MNIPANTFLSKGTFVQTANVQLVPALDGGWSLSTYALDLYAASML